MSVRLSPELLPALPPSIARPAYDRARVRTGIAHLGVGAFHRCHQAEFTDDLLAASGGDWGIVGINLRPPELAPAFDPQGGLYTRLMLEGESATPRINGAILRVVDSQQDAGPALAVLADPSIHLVTMTVTEKGYCHHPADGQLDFEHPDIRHDLAHPEAPRSVPGALLRALELRRVKGAPLTLLSCDNIPSNGHILRRVVMALAERRGGGLPEWIEANAAFPCAMVDRIAPAVTEDDRARLEREWGYRDEALAVCEPFRQWVFEDRAAGPMPDWASVGALRVADVEPYEILKMRVLNGAQTTLCTLGALAGLEYTADDMADPVLAAFVERMLREETLPTLRPVPGIEPAAYLAQSLSRLRNRAIRHRNHQIATDTSQKIVQRILNPIAERLRRGERADLLAVPVASWMAYVCAGAPRFGARWRPSDPAAAEVIAIAERVGADPTALAGEIMGLAAIFPAEVAANEGLRAAVKRALGAMLEGDPRNFLRDLAGRTDAPS